MIGQVHELIDEIWLVEFTGYRAQFLVGGQTAPEWRDIICIRDITLSKHTHVGYKREKNYVINIDKSSHLFSFLSADNL